MLPVSIHGCFLPKFISLIFFLALQQQLNDAGIIVCVDTGVDADVYVNIFI